MVHNKENTNEPLFYAKYSVVVVEISSPNVNKFKTWKI